MTRGDDKQALGGTFLRLKLRQGKQKRDPRLRILGTGLPQERRVNSGEPLIKAMGQAAQVIVSEDTRHG